MWIAYQSLKTYHRRPSTDLEVTDTIAAWCVDGTVLWFGITVENALAERVPVLGKKYETQPRYTLAQLLDDGFTLPRPPRPAQRVTAKAAPSSTPSDALAQVLALAGQQGSGVKKFVYVGPEVSKVS